MDISKLLVADPKTKEPSVSLTMLLATFSALLVACGLQMYGKVENVSSLTELFYANVALYWGRRFSGKSGNSLESSNGQTNS